MRKSIILLSVVLLSVACVDRSHQISGTEKENYQRVLKAVQQFEQLSKSENLASPQHAKELTELENSFFYDFDPMGMGEEAVKACEQLKLRVEKARDEIHRCLTELQKTALVSVISEDDLLLEKTEAYPVYLKKGETLYWKIATQNPAQVRLYNTDSRSRLKNYAQARSVSDSLAIQNTGIYLVEIVPGGAQYVSVEVAYHPLDMERLCATPTEIRSEEIPCGKNDFRAVAYNGIKMVNLFEEPRKFTLRSQLKAAFSGNSKALAALQIPAGTTDVLYSLRISTSESDKTEDGKFYDGMSSRYRQIRFFGLPVYESASNSGLLKSLLDDNRPIREEDAYCNMYLFKNTAEAKRFQDNASATGTNNSYNYDVDFSQMGTQSCNGRIPTRGARSFYLGFENERVRYTNYIWLEAIAAVPTTEYHTTKYSID